MNILPASAVDTAQSGVSKIVSKKDRSAQSGYKRPLIIISWPRFPRFFFTFVRFALHTTNNDIAAPQVDVYLDLACPDSAAAWPTVRQIVWEYGFRTEFVLHILPTSQSDVAFDAAKVGHLSLPSHIRLHTARKS